MAEELYDRLCELDGGRARSVRPRHVHGRGRLRTTAALHGRGGSTAASARPAPMPDVEFSLGWVIVYVDAADEAARFYETTFGLTFEFAAPDGSYAQLDTGRDEARLRVLRARREELRGRRPPGGDERTASERRDHARHRGRRRGLRPGARGRLLVARRAGGQAARPARRMRARPVRHARRARDSALSVSLPH